MKFARFVPPAGLALGLSLVSCTPYYPPDANFGGPSYQREMRTPVPPRDYNRYGIPPQGQSDRQPPPRYRDGEPRNYERLDPPRRGPGGYDPEPPATDYPVAERSGTPNQVISPYPPYSKIDVTGFRSGQLARDPKSNKIFQVP